LHRAQLVQQLTHEEPAERVAVNIANPMLGGRFPWAEPVKRYSPQELNEAKSVLSAIR